MMPFTPPPTPTQTPAAPMPAAPTGPTLAPAEVRQWWARIELARQRRKKEADKWKRLLEAYLPPASTDADAINSNVHFRNVETKKGQLFFQLPDLQLTALPLLEELKDPQTGQPIDALAATAAFRELLNKLLGRDYADVKKVAIDPALFDVLATSGIGAVKVCYEADLQDTPNEVPGPEQPQVGSVLGLQTVPGPTVTQNVPVPVCERWRAYRFSTNKFLQPHDWHSTHHDEAPWLAMEFVEALTPGARKKYNLPDDFQANATRDDLILTVEIEPQSGSASLIKGVEVWLHTAQFDPTVAHSQRFRRLVLIEGRSEAVGVYEDSPYQTVGPDGRLTNDSLIGNPIHPLTIRDLADSAWPPSDSAFTDPLVKQKNTWRSQDIKIRDSNIPRFLHSDAITTQIDKLRDADVGQGVAAPDELMVRGLDKLIQPLPHLDRANADIQGEAKIEQDLQETLGLGANQAGVVTATRRTATENAIVSQAVSNRLQGERMRTMEWYLGLVRKFAALVMRYGDVNNLAPIIGMQHAQLVLSWKSINGRNAFDARPDSQLSIDEAQKRKSLLDLYNFLAKSPFANQEAFARLLVNEFGYDASQYVQQPPQPPPPAPPPPRVSLSFGGADLAIPEVRTILTTLGIQLDPQASPEAQMAHLQEQAKGLPHGGAADRGEVLSKHHGELTGAMPGAVPAGAPPAQAPVGVQ